MTLLEHPVPLQIPQLSGVLPSRERERVCVCEREFSHFLLFATPWTVAHQAPPSMGFSRQEHWSGLPFPPPGDLPNARIEPKSCLPLALASRPFTAAVPGKPCHTFLLLLLSRFSRVQLCATPQTAAHQATPSLGFSRQEHWSGLPFPSPMHESEE